MSSKIITQKNLIIFLCPNQNIFAAFENISNIKIIYGQSIAAISRPIHRTYILEYFFGNFAHVYARAKHSLPVTVTTKGAGVLFEIKRKGVWLPHDIL